MLLGTVMGVGWGRGINTLCVYLLSLLCPYLVFGVPTVALLVRLRTSRQLKHGRVQTRHRSQELGGMKRRTRMS